VRNLFYNDIFLNETQPQIGYLAVCVRDSFICVTLCERGCHIWESVILNHTNAFMREGAICEWVSYWKTRMTWVPCWVCISESVSFLSPVTVKTRSTYGPTIVAIAQGSFAWRQIWRRDWFVLYIEHLLERKEPLWIPRPQYIWFGIWLKIRLSESTHYPRSTRRVPCAPRGSAAFLCVRDSFICVTLCDSGCHMWVGVLLNHTNDFSAMLNLHSCVFVTHSYVWLHVREGVTCEWVPYWIWAWHPHVRNHIWMSIIKSRMN